VSDVADTLIGLPELAGSAVGVNEGPESSIEAYRFDFESLDRQSKEPAWMREFRRSAMGEFERLDFPTMKDEDWHFTNIAPVAEKMFGLPRKGAPISDDIVHRFSYGQSWNTVVFVNGRLERIDVRSKGIEVSSLASEIAKDSDVVKRHLSKLATPESASFTALNTALASDGAVLRISADAKVDEPIHLLFVTDATAENTAIQTRNLVFAERHSECTIIESYVTVGGNSYFSNAVTEVFVADGARLSHYKLQTESTNAFHVGTIQVHQAKASRYESF
jgi:Fe-S cluster assembly protein SufD